MTELLGIARFEFKEGRTPGVQTLLPAQAMEIVRTRENSGTLQYDTYFNDDQSECIVIERYRDSEAAIEHAANLADVSAAVLAICLRGSRRASSVSRVQELRAKLADSEVPQLFTLYESM